MSELEAAILFHGWLTQPGSEYLKIDEVIKAYNILCAAVRVKH